MIGWIFLINVFIRFCFDSFIRFFFYFVKMRVLLWGLLNVYMSFGVKNISVK